MRIIPALDLQKGVVVRGVAGRRHLYGPVSSRLTSSCRPLDVAQAFAERFGLSELYIADLDAIGGAAPSIAVYQTLREKGFRLWVDAGLVTAAHAAVLASLGIDRIIVALETVDGPETIASLCATYGRDRVVFSLDLRAGELCGKIDRWRATDAASIAKEAVDHGAGAIIILDMSKVGMNAGTSTEALCRRLVQTHPDVEIIPGGGVRDATDLFRLKDIGVGAVLVASVLHDGSLSPNDVARLHG